MTEVAIYPDRVEVRTAGELVTFRLRNIAKRQEHGLIRYLKRLFGRTPLPLVVGERAFCTGSRYVAFYTNPVLKIHTPADADAPYAETFIFRINAVLREGGYCTYDMS